MTGVTMTVEGADRLGRTMSDAARELEDMTKVHGAVAGMMAGAVNPPRLTGRLAGSITHRGTEREAIVGSGLVYAPPIEFGWPRRNIRARRFLADAFAQTSDRAVDMYADAVNDAIRNVKGA